MKSTTMEMAIITVWSVVFMVRNQRHTSTLYVCGMLVYGEHTSMVTNRHSVFVQCSLPGNYWTDKWPYPETVGFPCHLFCVYACLVQMKMIMFSRNELLVFMWLRHRSDPV